MSAAGNVNIVLSVNQATYSAAMKDAQRQLDQMAQKSTAAGHATVSSMQASSAALRVFEGGMNNSLRAGERFLSMIPGVGKALQAAFPVVGAIAFGAIIAKVGKELYDFEEKARKLPDAIGKGFNALALSSRTAADEVARTNANLDDQIAKLEGKPKSNGLVETLLDAKLAADELATSLQGDADKMAELLAKNHISVLSGIVGGNAPTAPVEKEIDRRNQEIAELSLERRYALDSGAPGQARADELLKEIDAKRAEAIAWAAAQQKQLSATQSPQAAGSFFFARQGPRVAGTGGDTAGEVKELTGFRSELYDQQDLEQGDIAHAQKDAHVKQLQAATEFAAKQKELQTQEVQAWHQQLEDLKASQDMTVLQEAQFWIQRSESVKQGSLAYRDAMDSANKVIATMRQQDFKARQEFDALAGGLAQPSDTAAQAETRMKAEAYLRSPGHVEDVPALKEQGAETVQYLKNLNEGIALEKRNASALGEESIAMAVATGQMSQLDAARLRANLHAQEYTDVIAQLDQAQANVESDAALTPIERNGQLAALANQRTQVAGQRDLQVLQDKQAIVSQTVAGATAEALGQMVDAWKDMAGQIAKTLTQTVGGFNDDLVKLLTQKQIYPGDVRRAFGGTVKEGAQGLLRTGLQKGESAIFGAFGVGKPDGSSVDRALWVRFATAMKSDAQAGIAKILGAKPGSGGAPSIGSDISNFISKVFGGRGGASSSSTAAAAEPSNDSDVARVLRGVPTLLKRPPAVAAATGGSSGDDSGDDGSWQGFPYALPLATQTGSQPNLASLMPGGDGTGIPNQNPGEPTDITTILHPAPSQAGNLTSKITSMLLSSFLHGNNQGGAGVGGDDSDGGDDSGGDITSLIGGGPSNSSNSDGMFQGFFAGGGDVLANRPALVGEKGPEVFMPTSAGKIVPNHQLGGSSTTHNISIDARGANDPAQVEAAVHRGMRSYLPQAVAAAAARVRDQQKRGPGMGR